MSGATLATGERLTPSPETHELNKKLAAAQGRSTSFLLTGALSNPLTLIHMQLVAFAAVLVASGSVKLVDLVFPVLATAYIAFFALFIFPPVDRSLPPTQFFKPDSLFLRALVIIETTVALIIPVGYVMGAFVRGDAAAVNAAAPHLFLLSCQVLTENFTKFLGSNVSNPVRALVPLLYNARRLTALTAWVASVFERPVTPINTGLGGGLGSAGINDLSDISKMTTVGTQVQNNGWVMFGRGVAAANLIFWTFNLFFFVGPVFLPRALKSHYELQGKAEQDKDIKRAEKARLKEEVKAKHQ